MRRIGTGLLCLLFLLALGLFAACDGDGGGTTDTAGGGGGGEDTGGGGGGSTDPDIGQTFTASITAAEGGTLSTASNLATLTVPAGALAADTDLTVTVAAGTADTASAIYDFGPDGQTFEQPVTLSVVYEGNPGEGKKAVLAWKDGDTWTPLAGSTREGVKVSAPVEHFSQFAIIVTADGVTQKGECGDFGDTFSPCGGDVVGTWTIDTMCIYWSPDDDPFGGEDGPFAQCPELVFAANVDWIGTYVLDATTATFNLDRIVSKMHWEIPVSCLANEASCGDLNDSGSAGTCAIDGAHCICDNEQIQAENQQFVQTYTIEGDEFVGTDDEGDVSRLPYCIQGDTAVFRFPEPTDGWKTGATEWLVLTRQ